MTEAADLLTFERDLAEKTLERMYVRIDEAITAGFDKKSVVRLRQTLPKGYTHSFQPK